MKVVALGKDGALKVRKNVFELYTSDIKGDSKHFVPGEWILLQDEAIKLQYLASVNMHAQSGVPPIKVITQPLTDLKNPNPLSVVLFHLEKSILKRKRFLFENDCCRLVFGGADFIPGLIVDSYDDIILFQINSAGLDPFRDEIKKMLAQYFPKKKIMNWDNAKHREREVLPIFEREPLEKLSLIESGIHYSLEGKSLQKVGYYYDHRENRMRMRSLIKRLNFKAESGLDLFCYVGSWGMSLAAEGIRDIDFVDQADMKQNVSNIWQENKFKGNFQFHHMTANEFLDAKLTEQKKYSVICCDPPAFAKKKSDKTAAIEGYKKLHRKLFKLLTSNSLLFTASCTHYVDLEEFQRMVEEAAQKESRNIQLLDLGMQGWDHPVKNTSESNNYIKYFAYWVE